MALLKTGVSEFSLSVCIFLWLMSLKSTLVCWQTTGTVWIWFTERYWCKFYSIFLCFFCILKNSCFLPFLNVTTCLAQSCKYWKDVESEETTLWHFLQYDLMLQVTLKLFMMEISPQNDSKVREVNFFIGFYKLKIMGFKSTYRHLWLMMLLKVKPVDILHFS